MQASSIFILIFSIFLGCGDEINPGCSDPIYECIYSDDCDINQVCSHNTCKDIWPPPGPLIEGSMTTPCVIWNNTSTGEPIRPQRFNDWCLSGIERAVECTEPRLWTMVCY